MNVTDLESEKERAVADQDFERAASLADKLSKLRKKFECVRVGSPIHSIFYTARSSEEYRELGGVLLPQEDTRRRGLRCKVERIDRRSGIADITILLDHTNREGRTLYGVPFADPIGPWPFPDDPGGSWHFLTS